MRVTVAWFVQEKADKQSTGLCVLKEEVVSGMSVFNVQDGQVPFMLLQGSGGVLPWDSGMLLAYRLRTTALQVSASTLQLYSGQTLFFGSAWRELNCTATPGALCVSSDSGVAIMGTLPVTTPRDVSALLPRSELLRSFDGAVCTSDRTGRSVGVSDVYTVSMCDLVEGALRFVMVSTDSGDRVYWTRDTTGVLEALVLSVIALYAATSLAQNLSSLMSKTDAPAAASWTELNLLACVVCVAVLLWMCEAHRGYYVAENDLALYGLLLWFLVVDVLLLCFKAIGPRDSSRNFGHQVGLSTVVLLLCSLRLHNTFNTPFLHVLFGLFGSRASCKLLQHIRDSFARRARTINLVSVLLDLGVWCCLLAYTLAQSSVVHDHLAVGVNVTTSLLLGLAMSVLIAERHPG